jgi:hypothetical protein
MKKINARLHMGQKEKNATVVQLEETKTRQNLIGDALDAMERRM